MINHMFAVNKVALVNYTFDTSINKPDSLGKVVTRLVNIFEK